METNRVMRIVGSRKLILGGALLIVVLVAAGCEMPAITFGSRDPSRVDAQLRVWPKEYCPGEKVTVQWYGGDAYWPRGQPAKIGHLHIDHYLELAGPGDERHLRGSETFDPDRRRLDVFYWVTIGETIDLELRTIEPWIDPSRGLSGSGAHQVSYVYHLTCSSSGTVKLQRESPVAMSDVVGYMSIDDLSPCMGATQVCDRGLIPQISVDGDGDGPAPPADLHRGTGTTCATDEVNGFSPSDLEIELLDPSWLAAIGTPCTPGEPVSSGLGSLGFAPSLPGYSAAYDPAFAVTIDFTCMSPEEMRGDGAAACQAHMARAGDPRAEYGVLNREDCPIIAVPPGAPCIEDMTCLDGLDIPEYCDYEDIGIVVRPVDDIGSSSAALVECNPAQTCGDGICDGLCEGVQYCPVDCAISTEAGACFDTCDPDNPNSCLAGLSCLPRVAGGDEYICYNSNICNPDVTEEPTEPPCNCGDGVCEQERCSESQQSCSTDCGSPQQPPPPSQQPPPPQPTSPPPPAPVCGDGVCNGDETCWSCSADCGPC